MDKRLTFKKQVIDWAKTVKVRPVQIIIQKMRKKWASCSSNWYVTFHEYILSVRKSFMDYVIVHELLHLRVPNHGKLFKSLMDAYLPGWQKGKDIMNNRGFTSSTQDQG